MKSSKRWFPLFAATAALLVAAAAQAARIDMKDPRRALGREDDIRVDCEMTQDTVSRSSPINITYRIQNLTNAPIAVADKMSTVTYDEDSRTITLSVGAEVPDQTMPHVVVIPPGAKKTLTAGGVFNNIVAGDRGPMTPAYVQVRVNVLRDLTSFGNLIAQSEQSAKVAIPDSLFDAWIDATDTIFCNTIPIHWTAGSPRNAPPTAEQRSPSSGLW